MTVQFRASIIALREACREKGLSVQEWLILSEAKGMMDQKTVRETVKAKSGNFSNSMKKLIQMSLIHCQPSKEDRRTNMIIATVKGKNYLEEINEKLKGL